MSLLFRVLYSWKCKGTHHKLAMDALRLVQHEQAALWQDLFLANIEPYLTGSKDPDNKFKDFRNHVLHVSENYWGGAIPAATLWYQRALKAFQKEQWQQGVYASGVLSHYVTDPLQPLHTGQTDAEGEVHRPCEWSISQSYDALVQRLETSLGGFPHIEQVEGAEWLDWLITQGAEVAHADYDRLVLQYDFDRGVKNPPAGLDEELQVCVARLIGLAASTFAVVLDHLFAEAAVVPPRQSTTLQGALSSLTIPVFWITKKLNDVRDRKVVEAMYRELQTTGHVEETLPEDDRTIRELHSAEVLGKKPITTENQTATTSEASVPPEEDLSDAPASKGPNISPPVPKAIPAPTIDQESIPTPVVVAMSPEATTTRRGPEERSRSPRFYLNLTDPIVDAPSIGNKTAARLQGVGIKNVGTFLAADVDELAEHLGVDYITPKRLTMWQRQSRLMCTVPGLRGHDVQILVACCIYDADTLADQRAEELQDRAQRFVESPAASRLLRDPQPPDLAEVERWIEYAHQSRQLDAA
ncbi:MAG: DUF4332 domain-containing protein [Planctomycetaceae bacterium]